MLGVKLAKNLKRRNIEAHYCPTTQEAVAKVLELIADGSSVTWGGSMTVRDMGLPQTLRERGTLQVLDRDLVESAEENNNSRIMTAVVRSAVWAEDGGEIRIERFDDLDITALTIISKFDGEKYYKRLYCAVDPDPLDGDPRSFLWESFSSEEQEFRADSGETLCEMNGFNPSIDGNMLNVDLESSNGTKSTIRIALRAGGAAE